MPFDRKLQFFEDMRASIDRILQFTEGMDFSDYLDDIRTKHAVERNILIISEAAVRLGVSAEELCPEVEWRNIRGAGNFIRHEYDKLNEETLWDTITEGLPKLRVSVERAIEKLS